jgi:hypothetical protein
MAVAGSFPETGQHCLPEIFAGFWGFEVYLETG